MSCRLARLMLLEQRTVRSTWGAGEHGSPPHTTQEKLQLDHRTHTTQNCQKIELCGHPTTKDLKKPH